jgi:hypothetical protein
MKRFLRPIAALLIVGMVSLSSASPARAQIPVFDAANWAQAVAQLIQIIQQLQFWLRQARRIPINMVARYHGHSVDWNLHDLQAGLLYAQRILSALNAGDPTGAAYRQGLDPLDVPTDILARMPASLQRRLTNTYAAIEMADSVSALAVDQMGNMRVDGPHNEQVAKDMEKDAVSTNDDFHTQTALLNKINVAAVLGLRMQDHISKALMSTLEQMIVANQRQRDAEAMVLNATIYQWRYGQAYGEDIFRNTAANIDGFRLR